MPKPDIGASGEYRFAAECLHKGMLPCWPSSDGCAYDMVIDTGKHLYRVQVKGTKKTASTINFVFKMRTRAKVRPYTKKDVDFVVLFVFAVEAFYIIPIADVRLTFNVKPNDPYCKNLKYRNAWHLLTAGKP